MELMLTVVVRVPEPVNGNMNASDAEYLTANMFVNLNENVAVVEEPMAGNCYCYCCCCCC